VAGARGTAPARAAARLGRPPRRKKGKDMRVATSKESKVEPTVSIFLMAEGGLRGAVQHAAVDFLWWVVKHITRASYAVCTTSDVQ
jgi:hypothetical protein